MVDLPGLQPGFFEASPGSLLRQEETASWSVSEPPSGAVWSVRNLRSFRTGNMNNVMSGIAEALVSTAVGILVAVPAVIFFNIFQRRSVAIEDNVGALGNAVCAQMMREAGDRAPAATGRDRRHAGAVAFGPREVEA